MAPSCNFVLYVRVDVISPSRCYKVRVDHEVFLRFKGTGYGIELLYSRRIY